jgi:hypothetical protein
MRVVQLATVPRNRLVVTGHLILSDRPLSGGSACKRMSTQDKGRQQRIGVCQSGIAEDDGDRLGVLRFNARRRAPRAMSRRF